MCGGETKKVVDLGGDIGPVEVSTYADVFGSSTFATVHGVTVRTDYHPNLVFP